MNSDPLVSVVILNRNKKEKLLRCLESVLDLDWALLEVLCVDNDSEDESVEAVRRAYGDRVAVISRSENSVTQGRNEGLLSARGEFVLSLDNDMLLPDSDFLKKAVALIRQHPDVGLLTVKIASPEEPDRFQKEHWWHPFDCEPYQDSFFYTHYFPEAAVLFRRAVLEEIGGYDEDFFMGFEQADLALRTIRKGWRVLYCPSLVAVEDDTREEFVSKRHPIHHFNLRNKLWTAWKHYPLHRALSLAIGRSLVAMGRGLRYGYPDLIAKALFQGLFPPKEIRRQRKPMTAEEWERFQKAKRGELLESRPESLG